MAIVTFISLIIASLFAIISDFIAKKINLYILIFLGVLSIFIAGFRIGENMPDYLTYTGYYEQIVSDNFSYFIEISFIYIVKLSNFIFSDKTKVLFLIYAIIGVSLKFYLIKKISTFWIYSVVIYLSNYFIIHEMIQIRAGVAAGFILLSLIHLYYRRFLIFLILILCATFFHYSSFIFLFLWLLQPNHLNKRSYLLFILAAYFIHFIHSDPLTLVFRLLPTELIAFKGVYIDKDRAEEFAINVFGIFILTRIIVLLYFLYFSEQIIRHNIFIYIILKLYATGIIIYILLADYPEISVRLSYTLMSTEIFLIPTVIYTIKEKYVSRVIIISYAFLSFILNVYITSYFKWE
jgi:hypothetical protein